MRDRKRPYESLAGVFLPALAMHVGAATFAQPTFGPGVLVQSDGADIAVPGYSVPSFVDWNGDGRKDLVLGQGGGGVAEAKVRVYLNGGSSTDPQFAGFTFVQSNGSDLVATGDG